MLRPCHFSPEKSEVSCDQALQCALDTPRWLNAWVTWAQQEVCLHITAASSLHTSSACNNHHAYAHKWSIEEADNPCIMWGPNRCPRTHMHLCAQRRPSSLQLLPLRRFLRRLMQGPNRRGAGNGNGDVPYGGDGQHGGGGGGGRARVLGGGRGAGRRPALQRQRRQWRRHRAAEIAQPELGTRAVPHPTGCMLRAARASSCPETCVSAAGPRSLDARRAPAVPCCPRRALSVLHKLACRSDCTFHTAPRLATMCQAEVLLISNTQPCLVLFILYVNSSLCRAHSVLLGSGLLHVTVRMKAYSSAAPLAGAI